MADLVLPWQGPGLSSSQIPVSPQGQGTVLGNTEGQLLASGRWKVGEGGSLRISLSYLSDEANVGIETLGQWVTCPK